MDGLKRCPHCLTVVLPMEEGACPSCRKNTNEQVEKTENLTVIRLDHGATLMELPGVCVWCGVDGQVLAQQIARANSTNPWGWLMGVFGCFLIASALMIWVFHSFILFFPGLIFFGIFLIKIKNYRRVAVELPICAGCQSSRGKPTPRRVDFGNHQLEFTVHKHFASKLGVHAATPSNVG